MFPLLLLGVQLASPVSGPIGPFVEPPGLSRKQPAVLLFRRYDAFFPLACVVHDKLVPAKGRNVATCRALLPPRPEVRLLGGTTVQLQPLAEHSTSAWDDTQVPGWGVDPQAAPVDGRTTELAIWPPDADLGLVSVPSHGSTRPPPTALLKKVLPRDAWDLPPLEKRREPPSVDATQDVRVPELGSVLSVSGGLRGLFANSGKGWRVLRVPEDADLTSWLFGRSDLDGDRKPEWLVFTKCVNEFSLELWSADFRTRLASFSDCGF